ncbi:MAG: type II toxin-antitoxin system prevent-host-death family antitoxin [Steroidobacteraceae bacterium]
MAKTVSMRKARAQLSRLLDQAAAGQEFVITKAGRAMARLVPLESKPQPKKFGLLKGQINVPDDFNRPLDEGTPATFEGR